jgi:phosphatidylglycerophosphate synthase
MSKNYPAGTHRRSLSNDIVRTDLLVLAVLAALATVFQCTLQLSEQFLWKVIGAFLVGSALTLIFAIKHFSARSFGPANQVTLGRGALVALLFGLIGDSAVPWLVVVVASAVLVLDGIDGWLARRFSVASEFGARFDMETDAVLLVALAGLAWYYQKAGSWILLAGLMRYLFVASSYLFPLLARPLPPKRRRQAAFVFQAIALILCISPVVAQPVSGAIALLGLAVLSCSFAADVVYLAREGGDLTGPSQV